jgi:hypothetical protein
MPAKNRFTKYPPVKYTQLQPFPASLLSLQPWRNFIRENGYKKLSRNLTIKVFSTLSPAKDLWQRFSPNESVFDLWEVRMAFYDAYKFDPYFLTIMDSARKENSAVGVLPLWFNTDKDYWKYVWFGSNWPEDNVFFTVNPEIIPLLLLAAPSPLRIDCIKPDPQFSFLTSFSGFMKEEEPKYFLDLAKFTTLNDFITTLKKKKRYNLRRDRKRLLSLSPKIMINEISHIEDLFNLSIRRFREEFPDEPEEHSAFEDERRKNVFRNLIRENVPYKYRIISTIINGKVEAVEMAIVYNGTYYALNSGCNISQYSGIGVFSNQLVLEDALSLKCKKIDFLEGDNNWKHSWQLDSFYQYRFKK